METGYGLLNFSDIFFSWNVTEDEGQIILHCNEIPMWNHCNVNEINKKITSLLLQTLLDVRPL